MRRHVADHGIRVAALGVQIGVRVVFGHAPQAVLLVPIETGERPPADDFQARLDAVPELDTRDALTRLWDHLKKGQKQRLYGWFQEWAGIEAQATVLRWYEPLVVPGLLQTEEYGMPSLERPRVLGHLLGIAGAITPIFVWAGRLSSFSVAGSTWDQLQQPYLEISTGMPICAAMGV